MRWLALGQDFVWGSTGVQGCRGCTPPTAATQAHNRAPVQRQEALRASGWEWGSARATLTAACLLGACHHDAQGQCSSDVALGVPCGLPPTPTKHRHLLTACWCGAICSTCRAGRVWRCICCWCCCWARPCHSAQMLTSARITSPATIICGPRGTSMAGAQLVARAGTLPGKGGRGVVTSGQANSGMHTAGSATAAVGPQPFLLLQGRAHSGWPADALCRCCCVPA